MTFRPDIYHGLWTYLFGPNSVGSFTTQYPLVVNSDGSINANATIVVGPVGGTVTDRSITTNGASQPLMVANASRVGYLIENPAATALNVNGDSIFINFSDPASDAGVSFEVTPAGYFPMPGMPLYRGAINIFGASGVKVIAKEFT